MSIKVIVADYHHLFREGLVNLLTDSDESEVVAQAENGKEAIDAVRKYKPDVVLMDVGMPIIDGIKATEILTKEILDIKIIAISMHSEKHYIKGMLEAGAYGYLLKSCTYDQLLNAINTVYSGKKYIDEEVTEVIILDYLGKVEDAPGKGNKLSKREREVLKLIAEGKSSREISEDLFVSVKTVGTHKQNILEKLELKTTTDLVKYALKNGIIHL